MSEQQSEQQREEQKQIDNGGPAYPLNWEKQGEFWAFGMTLRDYFAAKAMQGLLASTKTSDGDMIVRDAYKLADAMLKERDK